jgi:hypothetical protein
MNDAALDSPTSQRRPKSIASVSSLDENQSRSEARPRVHISSQGKGGVGKSFVASTIVQFLRHQGRPVKAFDADPINATLTSTPGLLAEPIRLLDEDAIDVKQADQFVEVLLTSDGDVVVDSGSASFLPLNRYLIENEIAGILDAGGKELVIHSVVTAGGAILETLKGLEAVVLHFPSTVRIVVWKNEFFGPVRYETTAFEDTAIYRESRQRIAGVITLRQWNPRTFGANLAAVLERKLTFDEALAPPAGFNTVERQRLSMIQREIFEQLARVI